MSGSHTLLARAALGVIAAPLGIILVNSGRLRNLSHSQFDRLLFSSVVVTRLALFVLIFFVLHLAPRGDVPAFYLDEATWVLAHRVPYRDFVSSYAPLHAYIDACCLMLWHNPLSIMFLSVLGEFLVLPLWLPVARSFLTEHHVRTAALLYLASPISLQFVTIDGQDNVLIAVMIAISLLLLLRFRSLLAGAVFGLSIATIKFLPLIYAPAIFLGTLRRWRWAVGTAAVLFAIYGAFAFRHIPIFVPFATERDFRTASDLPYLIESILGITIADRILDSLLLMVLGALFALVARVSWQASEVLRIRAIVFGIAAITLALLLFSKKSWPPYLVLTLFPICLLPVVASQKKMDYLRVMAFAIFSSLAITSHSFWSTVLSQRSSGELHDLLVAHDPRAYWLLVLQILLIAGYIWLLFEAIRQLNQVRTLSKFDHSEPYTAAPYIEPDMINEHFKNFPPLGMRYASDDAE